MITRSRARLAVFALSSLIASSFAQNSAHAGPPPLPGDASTSTSADDGGTLDANEDASSPDVFRADAQPPRDASQPRDAGMRDAGGCGTVTARGECHGTVRTYCDESSFALISYDCAEKYTSTTQCTLIDPQYGFDCAESPGHSCLFEAQGQQLTLFCAGQRPGCLESNNQALCMSGLGPCGTPGSCNGALLTLRCRENQPYIVDCDSYGATCSDHACHGVRVGGPCDETTFLCADGLQCLTAGGVSLCAPMGGDAGPTPEDAGFPDAEAEHPDAKTSTENPRDSSGCSCSTSGMRPANAAAASSVLLLFALVVRPRRRSR